MRGRIVALSCGTYSISDGMAIYNVKPKGVFRNRSIKPIVGDFVGVDSSYSVIKSVEPRRNNLIRPNVSNLDRILVILSIKEPDFSYYLACKYLTYANAHNIPAALVITKTDLIKNNNILNAIKEDFEKIGVSVYFVSNKNHSGIEEIKNKFNGETICLMGQSGVGKSSLINEIDPNFDREIGEYSLSRGRGKHKTTEVILLPYNNGYIVDTPGFSELDLDITPVNLSKWFIGFENEACKCKFNDCLHVDTKGCKIIEEVNNGNIPKEIYNAYLLMLEEAKCARRKI